MITKKIQAKKVLYDLLAERVSLSRNDHTIFFDSRSEYSCYTMLRKYFDSDNWKISIHAKLITSSCDWKLDFLIEPKHHDLERWTQITSIATIVNGGICSHPMTHLWVEFKGIQDANFTKKMGLLKTCHKEVSRGIILTSDKDSAFGVFDSNNQKFHTHPIISMYNLENVIRQVLG